MTAARATVESAVHDLFGESTISAAVRSLWSGIDALDTVRIASYDSIMIERDGQDR